jgi:hypothetical protein
MDGLDVDPDEQWAVRPGARVDTPSSGDLDPADLGVVVDLLSRLRPPAEVERRVVVSPDQAAVVDVQHLPWGMGSELCRKVHYEPVAVLVDVELREQERERNVCPQCAGGEGGHVGGVPPQPAWPRNRRVESL